MRPNHRTWRIRGIPPDIDRERLARALRHHSDLQWPVNDAVEDFQKGGNEVTIHTLAPDLRANYQVATVRFRDLPSQLQGARDELNVMIKISPEDPASEIFVDEHFDGITTLFSPVTDEGHQIDILAVSGLGSHPFGSFVNKKDGNMWLTNNLPRDMPAARVMIFGYESKLQDSRSHVELDDLAGPVQIAISQIFQSKSRPVLLIGHSLGGLLVKEAIIRIAEPGFGNGLPNLLDMITGVLLFGTPNDGLDIESLVPMVNDQPNRSLLESLNSKNSQVLRRQKQQFSDVLERTKLKLFCFYETELSPTAIRDPVTGRWKMDGPHRFLVSQPSATSCLPAGASSARSVSIRRNHSALVKFSSHDAEYDKVVYIIKQTQEVSASHRTRERDFQLPEAVREPQNGDLMTGNHRRLTGDMDVHNLVKRPGDDMLPALIGKRPRLVGHSRDKGESHAGEDTASRDSALRDEIGSLKEVLIRRLYFSKIDERLTHLTPAQGTTCRWFLTDSKYQSWQDMARQSEHGGFLWIKGHPGTGKSTLMKYLFQDTKDKSQNDPSHITLSFFFLARGTTEEKTTMGLYRSLLHQLFEIAPDLKRSLGWMTDNGARTIERNGWSEEALKQTLKYAVPILGKRSLTMFVDALDECDADKADDMVSFFEELCECAEEAEVQLRICFSSRYYPTVVINKGVEVSLEVENGHAEDIRKYVKSKLKLTSKSKPAEALRSEILDKSSGIFLWVVLVLDILNKKKSSPIQKLRDHLKGIPPGLDDLFRIILARDGDNLEQLKLCLHSILFASRALKPQELYFAVQLGSDKECSGFWDETDLDLDDMKAFVRSSSKGLAEVTRNKASEVQFIHESVRDFLLGKYRNQWSGTFENIEGHGHRFLRDCCLSQLNASISKLVDIPNPLPKASQTAGLRDIIGLKFPFLKYSIHNILHHSNIAQRNGIEQGHFLSDFPLQRWISLNNILEQYEIRRYTDSVSLVYIFGEKDLADLIQTHSQKHSCFQVEEERCGAPILAALANNSVEAVRAFLRAEAENEPTTSPLHGLCERYEPHENSPTRIYRNPSRLSPMGVLHDLIDNDEEAVALAFSNSPQGPGEPLSSSNSLSFQLLSLATERGHVALVNLWIQRSAHANRKCEWLDSLLLQAVDRGDEAIVRILFDACPGIQPSRQGQQRSLCRAVRSEDEYIVKLLLERGVDVDSKTDDGHTVLLSAARQWRTDVFQLLLMGGADIDSRDKDGQTPLSWAAGNSRVWQVSLLLEKGAEIDPKDKDGRTPLSRAATTYGTAIVVLLLEKGAEIDSEDKDGRTPLSWAASNSRDQQVSLLLEKGAEIDSKDNEGRTPLSRAAANFTCGGKTVEAFLKKGADVMSKDKDGRTPLSWALSGPQTLSRERIISLLRDAGARN